MGLDMTCYEVPQGADYEEYERELDEYLDTHNEYPKNFVSSNGVREIAYFRRHYPLQMWLVMAGSLSHNVLESECGWEKIEITKEIADALEDGLQEIVPKDRNSDRWDEMEKGNWEDTLALPDSLKVALARGSRIIYTASY